MATAATISIFMGALGVGYAGERTMSWNPGFLVKPAAATACPRSRWLRRRRNGLAAALKHAHDPADRLAVYREADPWRDAGRPSPDRARRASGSRSRDPTGRRAPRPSCPG